MLTAGAIRASSGAWRSTRRKHIICPATGDLPGRSGSISTIRIMPESTSRRRSRSGTTRSTRSWSPQILVVFTDRQGNELLSYRDCGTPAELIREFRSTSRASRTGCSHDHRIHLGDHCPEPHRNSAEHPEEHLVLLPLGVGQHRVAGLRPLVRTLQSGGIGCRASGLRRLGSHCVETKKPLDVRG